MLVGPSLVDAARRIGDYAGQGLPGADGEGLAGADGQSIGKEAGGDAGASHGHRSGSERESVALPAEGVRGSILLPEMSPKALLCVLEQRSIPREQIGEIMAAETWEDKARLGLVALAAKYHNHAVTSKLRDMLDSTCDIASNKTFLEQAACRLNFNLDDYVCARRVSLETKVSTAGSLVDTVRVLELGDRTIVSRHISCPLIESCFIDFQIMSGSDASREKTPQLTIVAGESGSGKTASAIASVGLTKNTLCLYHIFRGRGLRLDGTTAQRDEAVANYLIELIKGLEITDSSPNMSAVLILDEMGSHPTIVRALCSIYADILPKLQQIARVKAFYMIAVGTGVDSKGILPGSAVHTYNVVRMSERKGEEFLEELSAKYFPKQLQDIVLKKSPYVIGREAWRVLSNRRVAAAFRNTIANKSALSLDWRQCLSTYLNMALFEAKTMNGFSTMSPEECMSSFADALAYSFGGKNQKIHDNHRMMLMVNTGILLNNCERVKKDNLPPQYTTVDSFGEDDELSKLVLHENRHGHRYSVSVASLENGLRGFGLVQRDHSGDGFENSVRDFVMLQMLAGSSGNRVTIDDPPHDVLYDVKQMIRNACKDVSLIVSIVLAEAAHSVADAIKMVESTVRNEVQRLRPEEPAAAWTPLTAGVVIKNAKMASAADVFVATITMTDKTVTTGLELALQMKHYVNSPAMPEHELQAEHYKMGDRRAMAIAGHVASTIPHAMPHANRNLFIAVHFNVMDRHRAHLLSKDLFSKKKGKKCTSGTTNASEFQLPKQFDKINARNCFTNESVLRQKLYIKLCEAAQRWIPLQVEPPHRHYQIIAVWRGKDECDSKTPSIIWVHHAELGAAMYPVSLPEGQYEKDNVVRELTTAMRCNSPP